MTALHQARSFVAGEWVDGDERSEVLDKYRGEPVAVLHHASAEQVGRATRAVAAAQRRDVLPPYERFELLCRASELLLERREAFVAALVAEGGFTLGDSAREVERAAETLLLCAEEAKRIHGEVVPLDGAHGRLGAARLHGQTPPGGRRVLPSHRSTHPLNTVAHKIGPALAAGNGVVLKPSAVHTPVRTVCWYKHLLEAGLPAGAHRAVAGGAAPPSETGCWQLIRSQPFYAFTGSTAVGDAHQSRRWVCDHCPARAREPVQHLVCLDDANLDACVPKIRLGLVRKAGQVCTSIQRLYVQRGVLGGVVRC